MYLHSLFYIIVIVVRKSHHIFLVPGFKYFLLSMVTCALMLFECAVDSSPGTIVMRALSYEVIDHVSSKQILLGLTMSETFLAQGTQLGHGGPLLNTNVTECMTRFRENTYPQLIRLGLSNTSWQIEQSRCLFIF